MSEDLLEVLWNEVTAEFPGIQKPELFGKLEARIKERYGDSDTAKRLKSDLDDIQGDFYDGHSCSANADYSGVCQVCGALVYMSPAYCDAYGCDPPERHTRYNPFTDCFEDIED